MNNRVLLATVAGLVAMFLLGYLIWGMLLMDTLKELNPPIEGVERDQPDLLLIALSNLALALLLTLVYSRWAGITTFRAGLIAGAWFFGLIAVAFDLMFLATTHMVSTGGAALDVVANIVWGGLSGGVIGWVLGYGKEG